MGVLKSLLPQKHSKYSKMTPKCKFDITHPLCQSNSMKKIAQKKVARKKSDVVKVSKNAPRQGKAPKASTVRLKPELQSALDAISGHLNRPKNKIVNQAVAEFLEKTTLRMRDNIEGTLQNLRAYRSQDPGFEADIERAAEAESAYAAEDAHEGKVRSSSSRPLSDEIQELIHA